MRKAVVFHDAWIGDGDIGGTLLKAGRRIAAGFKERVDQIVSFSDGGFGMIDEAGLDGLPFGNEALPLGGAEIANLEGFNAGSRGQIVLLLLSWQNRA